jgi:hypothetical protein
MRSRLQAQEPFVPVFNQVTADILWENRRNDEAAAILKTLPPTLLPRFYLAQVYASMGRYGEAADALREIPSGAFVSGAVEQAARLLRAAPAQALSTQTLVSNGLLGFVYLYAGAPGRALDFFEGLADGGSPALGNFPRIVWSPAYAPVRKTERFRAYARKAVMVEYWKARGWPDLCHPVGADDFACN